MIEMILIFYVQFKINIGCYEKLVGFSRFLTFFNMKIFIDYDYNMKI